MKKKTDATTRLEENSFFGETLKEVRKSKSLTQIEIADRLQITQAQWSAYELGKSMPGLKMIVNIAEKLEISPLSLIARSLDKTRFANVLLELSINDYEKVVKDMIEPLRNKVIQEKISIAQTQLKK